MNLGQSLDSLHSNQSDLEESPYKKIKNQMRNYMKPQQEFRKNYWKNEEK